MIRRVDVTLLSSPYPIWIDPDREPELRLADEVAALAGNATIGLITDETVNRLHRPRVEGALARRGLRVATVVVPEGEKSKSLACSETIAEAWVKAGLDRQALIVALGGGVVGDLGGFVASIFLRGVSYVQVPTTLLAQVDSSVGGKTGVNLPSGKNLVGSFHQPAFVYIDLSMLTTLSERDRASGLAELVKHGLIADRELLLTVEQQAESTRAGKPELLAELIARSVAVKAAIVASDERETATEQAGGGRARLNYGHTVGHAIESAAAQTNTPLRHGEAVALGMLAAARLGRALGVGEPGLEARLCQLWARLGLPTDLDARMTPQVLALIGVDKKRAGTRINLVLVDQVGSSLLLPIESAKIAEILLQAKVQ